MHSKPYPQQVSLEISNCCNLKCPICPLFQGSDRMNRHKRPPQYMSYDLFAALAEQIASWPTLPDNIFLNMFGEPLMDDGLERKMRRLQDLGLSFPAWILSFPGHSPPSVTEPLWKPSKKIFCVLPNCVMRHIPQHA